MFHPVRRASTAPRGRHGTIVLLVAILVLTMVAGAVVPAPRRALAASATTTTALNLRSGPGTSYPVLRVMPQGATVTVDGDPQNGFYRTVYAGTEGWASSSFLSLGGGGGGGATTGTATTTTSLNLRAGAGTGYSVLRVMPAGSTVTLTGQQANGFVSVTYQGTAGWAASQYLTSGGTSGGDDGGGNTGSTGACADAEERAFLGLINDYRAANGLPRLQLSASLSGAADYHSVDMANKNYFSHTLANGVTWLQNIANFGYTYNTYQGENIAAGNQSASATFDQWRNSPSHNATMLNPNFTAIGIGRAYNGNATYDWYWTTTFGGYVDAALTC